MCIGLASVHAAVATAGVHVWPAGSGHSVGMHWPSDWCSCHDGTTSMRFCAEVVPESLVDDCTVAGNRFAGIVATNRGSVAVRSCRSRGNTGLGYGVEQTCPGGSPIFQPEATPSKKDTASPVHESRMLFMDFQGLWHTCSSLTAENVKCPPAPQL